MTRSLPSLWVPVACLLLGLAVLMMTWFVLNRVNASYVEVAPPMHLTRQADGTHLVCTRAGACVLAEPVPHTAVRARGPVP